LFSAAALFAITVGVSPCGLALGWVMPVCCGPLATCPLTVARALTVVAPLCVAAVKR
jgi:hypothetical protein